MTEKGPTGEDGHTCQNDDGQDQEQGMQETKVEGIQPVKQVQMASYIDFAVDNQRSVAFVVFAWVFYVTTSLTYISLLDLPFIGLAIQISAAQLLKRFGLGRSWPFSCL